MPAPAKTRLLLAVSAFAFAAAARAQGPRGGDALSPAAVADSLAVLAQLDSAVVATPRDAGVWYRRGMIAWALADRGRATPAIRSLDWTTLGRLADTSLRIAAQLAPTNAHYRLMVGRYLLASGVSITRFASGGFFDDALTAARADTNRDVRAEAAIEVGRTYWRRYDSRENRRIETTPGSAIRSITEAAHTAGEEEGMGTTQSLKGIRDALDLTTQVLPFDLAGGKDYVTAEALFREACDASPTNRRAFQQLAMLLAARDRWVELDQHARARLAAAPWDAWGWLTLGLATHRRGDGKNAASAFDSAMVYLTKDERARFDRIERILRDSDTTIATRGDAAAQAATRRLYWLFADPLWSREGNESRVEFLARVAYAELRWTVEELAVHGVDSDRGDIYVRYGPPDVVASFGGDGGQGISDVATLWVYNNGLMFSFTGAPTFATARIPREDRNYADAAREGQPVRWDNLTKYTIDSLPVQVARFRGGRDSVDVFLAATPEVARIRASSVTRATPRVDYWLLAGGTMQARRDSAMLTTLATRSWTHRVAPGVYVYRVEASVDNGTRGARSTAPLVAQHDSATGFTLRGFGLSDLLLASSADQRGSAPVRRWRDVNFAPISGTIPPKSRIALVWENYDLGVRNGAAEYRVAVIVERERSAAGRVAARVVSRVSGAVGVDRSDDRVATRFDRTMPHATAIADYLTIELDETPAGSYRLTLEITDIVTGLTAVRTAGFVIK